MKIMHVLNSREYSGAEVVVAGIIHAFETRENVEMVYCSPESEQVSSILREQGIRYVPVQSLNVRELKRVIRQEQPDFIHAHDMRASFVSALSCGKIPLLFHIHNNAFDARGISPKSVAFALASRKAKHILWVSPGALKHYAFRRLVEKKSSILVNVVDGEAIRRKVAADPQTYDYDVVYCGRLAPEKDPLRLIRVCSMVKQQLPALKVGIIGEGALEQPARELVRQLGMEDNVEFLGYRTNPMKIIHDARLISLTSLWEGCPMCLLEGMAVGTVGVCADFEALDGILLPEETGLIGRTDEELADAMVRVLTDEPLRGRLSRGGLAHFQEINNAQAYYGALAKQYGLD